MLYTNWLVLLMLLWASYAHATTNISTTLNMTSPTGLISCTGPGCTVSATLGYFKNTSTTIASMTSASLAGFPIPHIGVFNFSGTGSGSITPSATSIAGLTINPISTGIYRFGIPSGFCNTIVPYISCSSKNTGSTQGQAWAPVNGLGTVTSQTLIGGTPGAAQSSATDVYCSVTCI